MLNGAAVAYCIRRIVNGQELESNRALVSLDEKLIPGFSDPPAVEARQRATSRVHQHRRASRKMNIGLRAKQPLDPV
jgi:hypothetical protein